MEYSTIGKGQEISAEGGYMIRGVYMGDCRR
jgi:hypothetical protein